MVAVCPTCHDAIHHGEVDISDQTVYRWKAIVREASAQRGHLYVEPGQEAKLLLGSVAMTGDAGLVVFELAKDNTLSFSLLDKEIVLLSLVLTDRKGVEVARLVDGYVTVTNEDGLSYRQAPGRHTITAPMNRRFMPDWALRRVQHTDPSYQSGDVESVTLLDLEVVDPGVVKVSGVWLEIDHGIVITPTMLHFVRVDPMMEGSLAFVGDGPESVLHYTGPITVAAFGFGEGRGAINVAPERRFP